MFRTRLCATMRSHCSFRLDLHLMMIAGALVILAGMAPLALAQTHRVVFEARLSQEGASVERGLEWRIFGPQIGDDGKLPLLASTTGGTRAFDMTAGQYLVHAAYGHAGAVRKIEIGPQSETEIFILNAGGLELSAVAGNDTPIPRELLRFDVYEDAPDRRGEPRLVARRMLPDEIIAFPEGTYHVVSTFGNLNAEIRADVRVQAGKLTKARLQHRAARITLRLVRSSGGDALANTQWSVINESGDLITESTSAFPRIVLLEGNYTAIAKNGDNVYSNDFRVRSGINRDVEVLVEG